MMVEKKIVECVALMEELPFLAASYYFQTQFLQKFTAIIQFSVVNWT